jgi:hypothetical protein
MTKSAVKEKDTTLFGEIEPVTLKVGDKITGIEKGKTHTIGGIATGKNSKAKPGPKPKTTAVTVRSAALPAQPAMSESTSLMNMIERAARDPSVDIGKMRELLAMRKELAGEAAKQAYTEAMMQAQTEMRPIAADATNPQTRSKYASLAKLDRALRPIYTKHGFAISFNTGDGAPTEHVRVVAKVSHISGHTEDYHIDMPADGKGAKGGDVMTKTHAVGSGVAYGQRYLTKMIFNVAVGPDDDGNLASKKPDAVDDKPITPDQAKTLIELVDTSGVGGKRFCEKYGLEKVGDLPEKSLAEATKALENYAANNKAK